MWLLALVLFAALAAAAVLFIQYRLENIRERVQQAIAARMGADFLAERVQVNGFRGISIRDFSTRFATPSGPTVEISAPEALIYIDLGNLFYGHLTVDRFQVDKAHITLERPQESEWLMPRLGDLASATGLENLVAFRVMGNGCTVELKNVVAGAALSLHEVNFDVSKLAEVPDFVGKISGEWGEDAAKTFNMGLHYVSLEDFDARIEAHQLSSEDINVFLPASRRFFRAGTGNANLRLSGYPQGAVVVSLDTSFEALALENQPALLPPQTGSLTGLATFDTAAKILRLSSARVDSQQLRGGVEGSISFSGTQPEFDLRIDGDHVPVEEALSLLLQNQPPALQSLRLQITDPYKVSVVLKGTAGAPQIGLEADVGGGKLSLAPQDRLLPDLSLQLGIMRITWDSSTAMPQGVFTIRDGTLTHASTGLSARNIMGTLRLEQGKIVADPLMAEAFGAPLSARAEYGIDSKELSFSTSGMVDVTDKSPLADLVKKLEVRGILNFRCSGKILPKQYTLDFSVDATRASVAYDWWLLKPAGVGANLEAFNLDLKPGKSIQISGVAEVDTARIATTLELAQAKKTWALKSMRAKSDQVEVATLNKCMRVAYTASGGAAREVTMEWTRAGEDEKDHDVVIKGGLDQLRLMPEEGEVPLELSDAAFEISFLNREAGHRGVLSLKVADAKLPPFGKKWFAPLRPADPELAKRFPIPLRDWEYSLSAGVLEVPPWKGSKFSGSAYTRPGETGLKHFQAEIEGGGSVEGAYRVESAEHINHLDAGWTAIPVHYLIEHLKFPAAITGTTTGNVQYSIDQDDPNTLKGTGTFEVAAGQFSADFLYSMLESRMSTIGTLPPSLRFSKMRAEIELVGDHVYTRNIRFESPGITISGDGQYISQGDMDYTLKVSFSPELAQQIPALRDNLNVEGHRISQAPIELAFRVSGPTFNPRGAVSGVPPLGVTLVSGAFEMTSEAMKVIDIPRQILLDLFKIGGGIVGATQ